ncbi:AraC family transcriptional regulator [uncultured Victivallis sp.]|uniref:helix-turn-helix domain-containing protein n=1 Tax=uncultured Victivallis sp. TaxID=354118 RepID=UPI0025DB8433|nr:AraC family transcriptional regulator [uncultured Victivallis sp.]
MEFFKLPDDPGRLSRAERILRAIEARCAISLTIHDRQGKLRGPDGAPLLPGRHLHPHECCARGRYQLPHWNTQCVRECLTETESRLATDPVPHLKTCWKTLTELVVPIVRGGVCQLTIFAGVFRSAEEAPEELPEWFRARYRTLPAPDPEELAELAELLRAAGLTLLEEAELRPRCPAGRDRRLNTIADYIRRHAHEKISLKTLGAELCLSPSRAGHLIRELCGRTFRELLEEERMLRARTLLLGSDHKLAKIAESTGYPNEFYFSRVFTRYWGITPGRFRSHFSQPPGGVPLSVSRE